MLCTKVLFIVMDSFKKPLELLSLSLCVGTEFELVWDFMEVGVRYINTESIWASNNNVIKH